MMVRTAEDLRYDYLKDEDMQYVYEEYPEAKSKTWCPSCNGNDENCDHELQRQLFKTYAVAGIGMTYMRLSWNEYFGNPEVKEFCSEYMSKLKAFKENNVGLMLLGSNGIGKTTAVSLLCKDLVINKQKVFFTTYSKLVTMLGDSFYSQDAKKRYSQKILHSTFLAIDDVGKEMSNRLTQTAIDNVLRERIQASRPTFLTSNMTKTELFSEYGRSSFSLLVEGAVIFNIEDSKDRRKNVKDNKVKLAMENRIMPIV